MLLFPTMVCSVDSHFIVSMLHPIPTGSVTGNIRRAQIGDDLAFEWLWHRYYKSLVHHIEKLSGKPGLEPVDPEEIAHNVFIALHDGLSQEKFNRLNGRFQLWKLLTLIGLRKTINSAKKDFVYRKPIEYSGITDRSVIDNSFDDLRFDEELEYCLSLLDNEHQGQRLRELALLKIKGDSNTRIADELGWTRKTVALRLNLIFEIWKEASEA